MTLNYKGILCESQCTSDSYIKYIQQTKKVSGKLVNYYEVIQQTSSDIVIPMNKQLIRQMSKWNFQGF